MTSTQTGAAAGTPYELDIRRQLNQARQDLAAAHAELAVRREEETVLRTQFRDLAADALVTRQQYIELRVAYTELLAHARATAAAAARAELAPVAYVAGHLEEIGLAPAPDAVPEQVVAEGLAVAAHLEGRQ